MKGDNSLKFYNSRQLRKKKCDYYIIIGQKSNGKSYDIKSLLVTEAYRTGRLFAYMRRWYSDRTASKVERYFSDETFFDTNNFGKFDEIQCYTDTIYLGNKTDKGVKTREKVIGYSVSLQNEQHFASLPFPNVYNILFEEFITDTGYLGHSMDEIDIFMRMTSTILRHRKDTTIYLLGNTINRFCPYFQHFNIDVTKIEKGNIYYYTYERKNEPPLIIGLEYCDNIVSNAKIFGKSAHMINGGEWQVNTVPLCNWNINRHNKLGHYFVKKENNTYKCAILVDENGEPYIFVYPFKDTNNIDKNDRYFTDTIEMTNICHSVNLTNVLTCDKIINELYKLNRVCYSDSLTGTEFELIRKERGWK